MIYQSSKGPVEISTMPPVALLRELLDYCPATGELTWRDRTPAHFTDGRHAAPHKAAQWNARYAGTPALSYISSSTGYRTGNLLNRQVRAHRVIWALQTGDWPAGDIDHKNGVKHDNRWSNLRDVSHAINGRNNKRYSHNTSGHTGVGWDKRARKWYARIYKNDGLSRKIIHLGHFKHLSDAVTARQVAAAERGFTKRHGDEV